MRMGDMFMFMKFVALLGITVVGIVVAATGYTWKGTPNDEWKTHGWFEGTSSNLSNWAVAIYAGLWAFDGWDNVRRFDSLCTISESSSPSLPFSLTFLISTFWLFSQELVFHSLSALIGA